MQRSLRKPAHVVVVEDEPDVRGLIELALSRSGDFAVETAGTGTAALTVVGDSVPDLVILDLNLPVLDGMEVFRILRTQPTTAKIPIIILTARDSEADRVRGLELGADDYVTKPFSPRELVARARAVLRRGERTSEGTLEPYRGAHLFADFDAVSIAVDGAPVRLTRREFELLRHFVNNRGRVISRDRLLERVWGIDAEIETRSVDVHIGRLRAKLGSAGAQIETVVGLGYRFTD
jgi:two-component system alkaline phosphatase synthesis response regulator PhoP